VCVCVCLSAAFTGTREDGKYGAVACLWHNRYMRAPSAKVLVAGEPNVAYICSRYYRAPELIFGASQYTTSIGTTNTE
jgi:hypothetical protein